MKEYEPKKAAPKKAPGKRKSKKSEAGNADHEALAGEEKQESEVQESLAEATIENPENAGAVNDSSAEAATEDPENADAVNDSSAEAATEDPENADASKDSNAEADTGKESEGTYNLPSIPVSLDMPDIQGLWNRYTIDKLIEQVHEAIINIYVCFGGDAASEIFSLEYAKNPLYVNGRKYVSVIQYMMSEKALLFGDINSYANILNESDPQTLLELGDKIVGADAEVWSKVFREVLFRGNVAKCLSDEEFKSTLLETGNCVLINADVDDDFYGAGVSKDKLVDGSGLLILDPDMWHKDGSDKQAENILGFVLMGVREYFMKTGM
ncbi:NADAR family protein [Butyrivibrio sp. NC2002]|uniref:NADAR family protein n=1 Tax=Butyrivibrio sp. NC2002 TaxID=1410610 RepID=UPI003FA40712